MESRDLDLAGERFTLPHLEIPTEGHQGPVYTIELKGSNLLSGSADRTIRLWNIETRRLLYGPLIGHEGSVLCLQSDPEQDVIISGGTDASIILWRFSTGELVNRMERAHEESVLSLCFDDEFLVTGSKDKTTKIWRRQNVWDVEKVTMLGEHTAAVNAVAMATNADGTGRTIVTGGGDRKVNVWSLTTSGGELATVSVNVELVHSFSIHQTGIACLQLVNGGRTLLTGSSDKSAKVYDLKSKTPLADLTGHENVVRGLQVIEEADDIEPGATPREVVTASYDGTIRFWERQDAAGDADSQQRWEMVGKLHYDGQTNGERIQADLVDKFEEGGKRVFKVQVETYQGRRRVICCGQGNVIVGWTLR